ncbi:hypothetical protein ABM016_19485 [Morganella morganii]|uniref:hypothetical protein n=1 Tax=Morganella morganii TaxID=582 RepID=UPI003EB6E564
MSEFTPLTEKYSVDECFCDLLGVTTDYLNYGRKMGLVAKIELMMNTEARVSFKG